MQPQMNPASESGAPAAPRVTLPALAPKRPRSRAGLIVVLLVIAAGAGWYAWQKLNPANAKGGGGGFAAVRNAPVMVGSLNRTLRLTGATTAEKYATLSAPRLRGGRGGGGGGGPMVVTVSTPGGGSSSTSSSTASTSTASTSTSSSSASSSSSSSSSSSAFRGASNRFTSTSTAKTSATNAATRAAIITSSGDGSADRMSGGAFDFMQVLQTVAKAGAVVKGGDTVGEFDTQYQQTRLDDYKAVVEQAERSLRSLDTNIEVARNSYSQNIEVAKAAVEKAKLDIKTIPVRSDIQAEQLRLALEEAQAQFKLLQTQVPYQDTSLKSQRRNSEITVEQSRIEMSRAERNVEQMRIKASMGGMLVMENMLRGSEFSQIQQGDQLYPGQLFGRIVDPNSMLVSATVNQADAESVRVGYRAELRFDAYPELVLPAHVVSIAALTKTGGMRASFVKEIPVFLKIDKMDPRVIPDLSVSADVFIAKEENQVLAPLEAVFSDGTGKPYVFVKTAAGYDRREVALGLTNNVAAAVTSGLKAGEVIALERPSGGAAPTAEQQASAGRVIEVGRKREFVRGVSNV